MIMFSIKNCNGILEGAAQVVKLFGDEPFTPDKYNAARGKGRSVAETLFNHNIIKVVAKRRFMSPMGLILEKLPLT